MTQITTSAPSAEKKLPNGWRWAKLVDISSAISKGTTPTSIGHNFTTQGIPFLRAEDVVGGPIRPENVAFHINAETHEVLSRSQLKPGDLLITIAGTLGRVGFVPEGTPTLNCNQAVAFVRLNPNIVDVRYACYACRTEANMAPLLLQRAGGAIQNLNLEQVKSLAIPLPPLTEQKRIVAILNEQMAVVEKARAAAETQCQAAKALSAAYLRDVFNSPEAQKWPRRKLAELCHVKGGKRLPKGASFAKEVTPYPYIRVIDFQEGSVRLDSLKYLDKMTHVAIHRYIIGKDDVYISIAGTIGIVGTIPDELNGSNLTENAARLIILNKIALLRDFLVRFLQSSNGQSAIKARSNTVGQPKLALERIQTIEVPLPSFQAQMNIAQMLNSKLAAITELHVASMEKFEAISELPSSLLRKAFKGEL